VIVEPGYRLLAIGSGFHSISISNKVLWPQPSTQAIKPTSRRRFHMAWQGWRGLRGWVKTRNTDPPVVDLSLLAPLSLLTKRLPGFSFLFPVTWTIRYLK